MNASPSPTTTGTNQLADQLRKVIAAHPGPDAEVLGAFVILVGEAIGSFQPVQRPKVLGKFIDALGDFLVELP